MTRPVLRAAILEVILVVLCAALAAAAPRFLTVENLLNVLRNVSMQGLIALGMTMVIIAGEIDLSVGSMVAFAGCLTAYLTGLLGGIGMEAAVTVVIPGAKTQAQARANALAADLAPLPPAVMAAARDIYARRIRAHVHGSW